MINKKFFFDHARLILFGGKLTQSQTDGLLVILQEWEANYARQDDRWLAYMLATAYHETDKKMQPIEEYGKGQSKPYGKRLKMAKDSKGNHIPYTDTKEIFFGRGFVQLTWYENYKRAGIKLNKNLLLNAALALDTKIATGIMFTGMTEGWFTARKLSQYFNATTEDWVNARRIINGTDKANLIAQHARNFYSCISYTK